MRNPSDQPDRRRRALVAAVCGSVVAGGVILGVTTAPAQAVPAQPVPDAAAGAVAQAGQDHLVDRYDLSEQQAATALSRQAAAIQTAADLTARLGDRVAGTVLEEVTGDLTVVVTDDAAAATVRRSGATAEVAAPVVDQLPVAQQAIGAVAESLGVEGTAVSTDVARGEVVVTVPAGTDARAARQLLRASRSQGVPVRVERPRGAVRTFELYGGEAIIRGRSLCSAGFNLRSGTEYFLLTAGHCSGDTWFDDGVPIGLTSAASFPGDDYRLIRISDPARVDPRGQVEYPLGPYEVTSAGRPPVGTTVCRTGATTGTRCGQIQGYDADVRFSQGSVNGLVRTNVCAQPGDSGGPLFAADGTAVGVLSGGNGNCSSGGTTFYQTVEEVTSRFGLSVL